MFGYEPKQGDRVWLYDCPRLKRGTVEKKVSLSSVTVVLDGEKTPLDYICFDLWPDTQEGRDNLHLTIQSDIVMLKYNLKDLD